jgi:hypothetical protein
VSRTFTTLPKFLVVRDSNNKTEFPPLMILGLCVSMYVAVYSKGKGKVLPLQARLWPRGWVEV